MAKQASESFEEESESTPQTALEFFELGWSYYSKKDYYQSETFFKKALGLTPDYVDALYGLGMAYQASNRNQEAIDTFSKVIALLERTPGEDNVRARMLARFARGHINRIQTGDWQMEN